MAKKKVVKRKKKSAIRNERRIKLALFIVFIIFIIVVYKIFDNLVLSKEKIDLSGEFYYQYFYGIKEEYSGDMDVIEEDGEVKLILKNGKTIYLDSTPIYYQNVLGKALFAKEMELVVPDEGMYKIKKFNNIIFENNMMYAKKLNKKAMKNLKNAFIFDGNDLYFFLEETVIKVGGQEYTLSPLSYAIVNYRQNVELYNYEKEEYTIINDETSLQSDILAVNNYRNYTINMSLDSLSTPKSQSLLINSISSLKEIEY